MALLPELGITVNEPGGVVGGEGLPRRALTPSYCGWIDRRPVVVPILLVTLKVMPAAKSWASHSRSV